VLLMSFALALAWENKGLIVGEAATQKERNEIHEAIESHSSVVSIVDLRTLHLGAENVLVTAEVEFEDAMTTEEIERAVDGIEEKVREVVPSADKIFVEAEDG
ncbi:MAG: cation transporter dimerization domain-containing protein, partial [Halobacteria archaeon]|nr:cation transporter dimerization domain-containing protein [Halobacteria archaeon]